MTDQDNISKPIESTGIFTSTQIQSLHDHWIETIEQIISAAVTDEGRDGLAKLLEVNKNALNDILIHLSQMLPSKVLEEISKPQPDKPRGVLFPKQQKKQNGSSENGGDK